MSDSSIYTSKFLNGIKKMLFFFIFLNLTPHINVVSQLIWVCYLTQNKMFTDKWLPKCIFYLCERESVTEKWNAQWISYLTVNNFSYRTMASELDRNVVTFVLSWSNHRSCIDKQHHFWSFQVKICLGLELRNERS